jgi:hypothetical protein
MFVLRPLCSVKPSDTNTRQTAADSPAQPTRARETSHTQNIPNNDGSQSTREPDSTQTGTVRRRFLQLVGSASLLGVAGCSSVLGKSSKEQVSYQDHPKGNQQCSNCQFYTPPENGEGAGTCSRVQGDIAPDAWCNVYAEG